MKLTFEPNTVPGFNRILTEERGIEVEIYGNGYISIELGFRRGDGGRMERIWNANFTIENLRFIADCAEELLAEWASSPELTD